MKVINFLFFLTFVLFLSCSSDLSNADDILEEEGVDDPKTAIRLEIEHASEDEINVIMASNSFENFENEFLQDSRTLRSERACLNAIYKGDLNGDSYLSVEDVISVYRLISEYDNTEAYPKTANGDEKLDVNKEYTGTNPSFWDVVAVADLVSFDEGGGAITYLDDHDAAVLVDILSGYCN